MQTAEIYNSLQQVFDETFLEKVNLAPELTAKDVEEWDSLLHVSLVLAIEDKFGIRFQVGEVEAAKNVGELVILIDRRAKG